jgi:hypothetical protein
MASYYLDLLDLTKSQVASPTFTTSSLRDLSTDCEVCEQVADGMDNARASGYAYEGGDLDEPTIGDVQFELPTADIAFTVSQAAARVLRADGSEVRTSEATLLRGGIVLKWNDVRDGWIATQLNLTN